MWRFVSQKSEVGGASKIQSNPGLGLGRIRVRVRVRVRVWG